MLNHKSILGAVAVLCVAAPSFAATTVKVIEDGEGGGAMSLTVDQPTVKAGDVVFQVHNDAMTEEHEMVLVKLKSINQEVAVQQGKHRVDEHQLKSLGEVSELKPGADGSLKAKLTPGAYLLLCNIKGHYEAGMHATLTAVK